ncbi:deoxycytidyl transferase [Dimargaris xerosporica]|nr:deoxycytidyl transferase [Dimargaris xerosporica]
MSTDARKRKGPLPSTVRTMGEYMASKIQKLGDQGEKLRDDYTSAFGSQQKLQQSGMHVFSKTFAQTARIWWLKSVAFIQDALANVICQLHALNESRRIANIARTLLRRGFVAIVIDTAFLLLDLLGGLRVFVTGFTEPPSSTIRQLTLLHGGEYIQYLTASDRVTVIIATQLTPQKIRDWGPKRRYRIVRPEWLVQSIAQGKRLPWVDFALLAMVTPTQPSLGQVFKALTRRGSTPTRGSNSLLASTSNPECAVDKSNALPRRSTDTISTPSFDQQHMGAMATSVAPGNPDRTGVPCTTDPNFLNHYYQSSRLHLLSSFKNELQLFVQTLQQGKVCRPPTAALSPTTPRIIMYVDFDCFFVAVGLRTRPHLAKKPVAVSHCQNPATQSSSDIASCNYIARKMGVKNGMRVGKARMLCPDLVVIPYEFDTYKQVSKDCYRILVEMSDHLQVGSMDEAVLDVTETITAQQGIIVNQANRDERLDPAATATSLSPRLEKGLTKAQYQAAWQLAHEIRQCVRQATQCQVSIGISTNDLLAKIATRWAKPNGQHYLDPALAVTRLASLSVRDLPGVGWSLAAKLQENHVSTVGQLQKWTLPQLQSLFGRKKGQSIFEFARGIDSRPLFSLASLSNATPRTMAFLGVKATGTSRTKSSSTRQSIGTEVGWGVRLETQTEVDAFVERLCQEVAQRMTRAEVRGQMVTLKLKKRRFTDAEPAKFMGHGICDTLTKSLNLAPMCTRDPRDLWGACQSLLRMLNIAPVDVRAVGIQVQKLVSDSTSLDELPHASRQPTVINWLQPPYARLAPPSPPPPVTSTSKDQSQLAPLIPSQAIEECLTPAPSTQIDTDVWQALPKSMRREIKQQFLLDHAAAQRALTAVNVSPSRPSGSATTSGALPMHMSGNHSASPIGLSQELFVSPSKWDPTVVQSMPLDMRRELELVRQHRQARLIMTSPHHFHGQAMPAPRRPLTHLERDSAGNCRASTEHPLRSPTDSVAPVVPRAKVLSFQPCDYDHDRAIVGILENDHIEPGSAHGDSGDLFAHMVPLTPFRQGLDLAEIKQFPVEIQRDIAAEYYRPRRAAESTRQLSNPVKHQLPNVSAKPPVTELTEDLTHSPPDCPRLLDSATLKGQRQAIATWVTMFTAGPDQTNVDELATFLVSLIDYGDLERTTLLMRYFKQYPNLLPTLDTSTALSS